MTQTEKPRARAASTDQKTMWSWKRLFGKEEQSTTPPAPSQEDDQRPGIARRLSRKVVPGLPRAGTFKRQQSELRDRLQPAAPDDDGRRTVSVDRRRSVSGRASSTALADSPQMSAPGLQDVKEPKETIDTMLADGEMTVEAPRSDGVSLHDFMDIEKEPSAIDTASISTEAFDEMILEELEKSWILNLSMHFRDKSKREKFFVTFAETPTHWRRVTISLDYRDAKDGSLEEELLRTRFQRDKSARIYEAIRESLPDIQFYDTVTNLKLQTENERLHVHVVEDLSEIISYPPIRTIGHLNCRRIREDELVFDSHLSGFVYKVRVDGQVFIKKEIPGPDTVEEFLYEINALHQLAGSHSVIQFGGVVLDNRGEFVKGLLISFAEQGALIDVLYDGVGQIPWNRRERWARQIVQGLSEIHEAGFVQGDFTLSNIVIDAYDNAKIIDINRRGCPVGWEPPEVRNLIDSNQRISMYIGVKSDLFQLGMVMYALATQHDEPETHRPLNLASFPVEIPSYFLEICHRCLADDPRSRTQASVLLQTFPEMEETYHEGPLRPVPIVVDATYSDEKSLTNGSYQCKSGIHSPPYSSSGMDRSMINVHDYAVTDASDDQESYPRRGRSPAAPHRTETAGTTIPFSSAPISFLQANVPLPRASILTPETTPLPDSSAGSEYLDGTRDTSCSRDPLGIPLPVDPHGVEPTGQNLQDGSATGLRNGFEYVGFAEGYTPMASEPLDLTSTHPENTADPRSPTPPYTREETAAPIVSEPQVAPMFQEPIAYHEESTQHQDSKPTDSKSPPEIADGPEKEKLRSTAAVSDRPPPDIPPSSLADLAGVGSAHTHSPHFEIPPPASLLDDVDDLMTDMHGTH
ncbi:hypothetical protein BJ875DRAFT_258357 [Amylocarpus encephaloides]|uniref:Protein kinase domain-containing protein n=1 Tax=Amylocarpus encephaloides TaxID=45428 RepID=A0A9P8C706_9HELO|nr:hypothetical protein BJ875DRAFT_258357 [Amylocarpus encephaloides]